MAAQLYSKSVKLPQKQQALKLKPKHSVYDSIQQAFENGKRFSSDNEKAMAINA